MAESLLYIPSLPGEWQRPSWVPVEASVAHFFEGGLSLCKLVNQEGTWESVPARTTQGHRRTACSTSWDRLTFSSKRPRRTPELSTSRPSPQPRGTLARAARLEQRAAECPERFLRVHILADAKAELLKARRAGMSSSFVKGVPRG